MVVLPKAKGVHSMKTRTVCSVILVAALIVCAGCGSGVYSHDIDVVFEPVPGGMAMTDFKVGLAGGITRESSGKLKLHSADSNGVVHLDYQENSASWVWQKRPAYVVFELYVPNVSTNGCFCFNFDDASLVPSRGLKRGKIDVRPRYFEFDRWNEGWRIVPTVHTDVMPSVKGGYYITLHLPIQALQDSVDAELIPYKPDAARKD
jgi:hypothetical protein